MTFSYLDVIQKHLHHIHADVAAAAYSESVPGWRQDGVTPDFYRLWYIEKGRLWIRHGEQELEAVPGDLVFVPAGMQHSLGTLGDEPLGRYWCHFRANLGDKNMFELLNLPMVLQAEDPELVTSLFRMMAGAFRSDGLTRGLKVNAALFSLLSYYYDHTDIREENLACTETFGKLNDALKYIEDHLSENISLEDLARETYLHPNYFIGIFKSSLGCSPIQYVNQRRLERAKKLLVETEISVSDIASQVGMQNHYLSRLFKHHTGLSPSRYRQIYRTKPGAQRQSGDDMIAEWLRTAAQASKNEFD